jgi:hypothetical protein
VINARLQLASCHKAKGAPAARPRASRNCLGMVSYPLEVSVPVVIN